MALRRMVTGKIHRANVSETELDYEGSIALDPDLYEAAGFLPGELLHVFNIDSGDRFETYLIDAERGSGTVSIRGAAARLAQVGDQVIILAYRLLDDDELEDYNLRVVYVDEDNAISDLEDK
ncbi:MAG: aspartate 1-decarboxylase [Candidatus Coatesbacteria bacterium]|nr:aspartate 1-decarboxylase [Candidatus Coatesbacteria bacterium]